VCREESSRRSRQKGRKGLYILALPVFLLSVILLSSCAGNIIYGASVSPTGAPGSVRIDTGLSSVVYRATNIGVVSDDQMLQVVLTFKLNQQGGNELMTSDRARSNSALDMDEVASKIGISDQLYQQIKAYFKGDNVKLSLGKLRTDLTIEAPASAMDSFFHTTLMLYKPGDPKADTSSTRRYYAPDPNQPPMLPGAIANSLLAVTGLDSYMALPLHNYVLSSQSLTSATRMQQAQCVNYRTDLLLPSQLGKAYGYDQLWNQGYRGKGMNMNIVSFDGYDSSDLENYFACVGYKGQMSVTVQRTVNSSTAPNATPTASAAGSTGATTGTGANAGTSNTGSTGTGTGSTGTGTGNGNQGTDSSTSSTSSSETTSSQNGGETTLDIEAAASMAPESHISLYLYNHTDRGLFDDYATISTEMVQRIINDNLGQNDRAGDAVSLSWGESELSLNKNFMNALNQRLWILTNVLHMTVFSASGDCGAFDDQTYQKLSVDFPASSPWSVAVGGTQLTLNQQGTRSSEKVWSDGANVDTCRNRWGSGGGLSTIFTQESWAHAQGSTNQYTNHRRQVPDVSAVAYQLPVYYQGRWALVNGTSLSAPLLAAGMLLLNQGVRAQTGYYYYGPQVFYQLANETYSTTPFYDITQGNNLYYPATQGWDFASGLGTPDLGNMLTDLVQNRQQ
jgi:subtilase family serine protease